MKLLASDEKLSTVMIYTQDMLVRGEVVVKEGVRVSIWLRTQGVPNYIRVIKPQILLFGSSAPKSLAYEEFFVPTVKVTAFHLAPPAQDSLDYDPNEANRVMESVDVTMSSFLFKSKMRISSQSDIATTLDVARTTWMSLYDSKITNPLLPQFNMQVPMMLVNPSMVSFGIG
jgi:hypothetical protein